ncbi:MAG: hypothetical protein MI976_27825 [Pseudomonadales bacterium]|nr:hypothetical protein [Pseudomonadales bacterium]
MNLGGIVGGIAGSFLGPLGGIAGQMAGQIFTDIATQIVDDAIDQLPFPQPLKDAMQGAFHAGLGDAAGALENYGDALSGLLDQMSPFQAANFEQQISDIGDMFAKALTDLAKEASEEGKNANGGGEGNFLETLARAMGELVGARASQMLDAKDKMMETGGDSQEDAQEFMKAQSEFQTQAQMFKILNDMASNVIKTIGEALDTMARKQ